MKIVEGKKAKGEIIDMDDCFFVNCEFENCVLFFNGGDFGWRNTAFSKCRIHFQGTAARTVQFLRYFGVISPKGLGILSTGQRDALTPVTKEWVQ